MTISYTCTFEDFAAANRLHRKPAPGQGPTTMERLFFFWVLLAAIGFFFVCAIAAGVYAGMTGARSTADGPLDFVVAVLAPWMLYSIICALLWFALAAALIPSDRRAFRNLMLIFLALMLLNGIVTTAMTGWTRTPTPVVEPAPQDGGGLASLAPWVLIFLFIWFFVFRLMRSMPRRHWDAQPHLALPHTMTVTDDGMRFQCAVATYDYRWSGMTKWREDDQIMLLYVSDVAFQMIPKRALSPEQLVQLREIVQRRVRSVDGPVGFPIPMAQIVHDAQATSAAIRPAGGGTSV
jgi:hypothetical protein